MTLIYTVPAALCIIAAACAGAIFASQRGEIILARHKHTLLAFSLGILSVTLYFLFHESVEHFFEMGVSGTRASLYFLFGTTAGALLVYLGTRWHPHDHHTGGAHTHTHSRIDGRRILIGDAIHNVGDGIVLYSAFLISPIAGLWATVGVFLHELVQETAEFFVLKEVGYTTKEALLTNLVTSCTIFIGIGVAALTASSTNLLPWLFSTSFGAFLYVTVYDMVPCVFGHQKNWRQFLKLILTVALGILCMYIVSLIGGH